MVRFLGIVVGLLGPTAAVRTIHQQEAFEKCWAHSPQRAAARHITIHSPGVATVASHAACASMSTTTTTTTTTTTRDRGDRYGPMEWAQIVCPPCRYERKTSEW